MSQVASAWHHFMHFHLFSGQVWHKTRSMNENMHKINFVKMKIITTLQFKSFVVFWHLDNDTRILFLLNNDWTTISDIIVSIYWFLFRLVLSTRSDYADYLYDNSSPSNLTLNRLHKIIDVKHNVSASLDEERIAFLGALAFICVWTAPFRWCILRLRKKKQWKIWRLYVKIAFKWM